MKGDKKMKKSNSTPKGLTCLRKGGVLQRSQKEVKYAQRAKLGKRTFDTYPSAYANLAVHQSIVKTLTMPRNQKVAKERASTVSLKNG